MAMPRLIMIMNGGNANEIHQSVGPDGYSWNIDDIGYHGINLPGLLVDTQKIHDIDFN